MNAAELAMHSERVLGVEAEVFYDESAHFVRDGEAHFHDAALQVRATLVFGCEHTDAFAATCDETVRELY